MKKQVFLTMVAALFLAVFSGYIWANDTKTITAKATVTELNPTFKISIYENKGSDYDWKNPKPLSSGMDFGNLVKVVPDDPTSPLMAKHRFLILVGVLTNTGKRYEIKYTGAPLVLSSNRSIKLPRDAWTVSAGPHYNPDTKYRAGITTGIHSAEDTYVVYRSNSNGDSDTIRLYFGITGDPKQAAGRNLIPPTQRAGTYYGTVKLDVYAK